MPRVLIVDDHAVIRRGVQGILNAFPDWNCAAKPTRVRKVFAWPASCDPKW
jgi:DNA-binding NarL/FixJ family response regulator